MIDKELESKLISRLEEIGQKVDKIEASLGSRIDAIEGKLESISELSALAGKIEKIEEQIMLVTDIQKYRKLQALLESGNFFEADWETIRAIQSVSGKKDIESITPEDIQVFPCYELEVIDRLWLKYSQGKFGFSVQLETYQKVGGSIETTLMENHELIVKLGEEIGWRENNDWKKCDHLDYTISAPRGCHPSRWWNSPFGSKMVNYFLNRLLTCELSDRTKL